MTKISLEFGNSKVSPFAYVQFSMVLGSRFGEYRRAFQIGKVAVELAGVHGSERYLPRVCFCYASLVLPWAAPLRLGRPLIGRAFDSALQNGDLSFAVYSRPFLVTNLLATGDELGRVEQTAEECLQFARKVDFGLIGDLIVEQLALIRNLRGLTRQFGSLEIEGLHEAEFEGHLKKDPRLAIAACWYWLRQMQARYFAGDYSAALVAEQRAGDLLWTSATLFEASEFHFYGGLIRAVCCDGAGAQQWEEHRTALREHHRKVSGCGACILRRSINEAIATTNDAREHPVPIHRVYRVTRTYAYRFQLSGLPASAVLIPPGSTVKKLPVADP
jgi:hypothetical protein